MRKTLLAGTAILGSASGALAQMEAAPGVFQSQGQMAMPWAGGPAPNNNNNAWGTAQPTGTKVPAPGTVVIRLNGRVYVEGDAGFSNIMSIPAGVYSGATTASTSTAGTVTGTAVHLTPAATSPTNYKQNPISISSFLRLYPAVDGMATNGMRYGASAEIRENFMGGNSLSAGNNYALAGGGAISAGSGAASASGVSSGQTLYVRRAFAYFGSDQMGIVRVGNGDGLIGLYDAAGIFTGQGTYDGGIGGLNDAALQATLSNNFLTSEFYLSGSGIEYGNTKAVYLTPSFFGFDFGLQYDPNMGNGFSSGGVTASPYQLGYCSAAGPDCINVTSGTDGTRVVNRFGFGVRYNGTFAGLTLRGFGVYELSGKESTAPLTFGTGAKTYKGFYDGQSFFNGGLAATYLGVTAAVDGTIGRMNPSNDGLVPQGAKETMGIIGTLMYANGPFTVGTSAFTLDWFGSPTLSGISQRHEAALAIGAAYAIAPGITFGAEYQYVLKHQGDFDFVTGANDGAYNTIKAQGVTLATIVSW